MRRLFSDRAAELPGRLRKRENVTMPDLSTDSPPIMELREVEARIPLLERIGADLAKVMERKEQIVDQCKKPGRGRDSDDSPPIAILKEELRELAAHLTELREEVQTLGGTIAHTSSATLEFLGEVEGCIGWFSWQPGEDTIQTWRPVDGEPGERFPLPSSSQDSHSSAEPGTDQVEENNEEETVA